jgi:hypothetical protein
VEDPRRRFEEAIRAALGLPPETPPSLPGLKKALGPWVAGFGEPAKPERKGAVNQGGDSFGPKVSQAKELDQPEAPREAKEVRELKNRLQKKAHEVQALQDKLTRESKAREKVESELGRKAQELARLARELENFRGKVSQLEARASALEEERDRLRREKAALEEAQRPLEEALRLKERELAKLQGRLAELEGALEAAQKRLEAWEALFRVLVLDYPNLGTKPQDRLIGLMEGYRALLRGEDHPALKATNRAFLKGEPEGIVVLGVELLLRDLASFPLHRWLRTHAMAVEAFLVPERTLPSPRLREVEE